MTSRRSRASESLHERVCRLSALTNSGIPNEVDVSRSATRDKIRRRESKPRTAALSAHRDSWPHQGGGQAARRAHHVVEFESGWLSDADADGVPGRRNP